MLAKKYFIVVILADIKIKNFTPNFVSKPMIHKMMRTLIYLIMIKSKTPKEQVLLIWVILAIWMHPFNHYWVLLIFNNFYPTNTTGLKIPKKETLWSSTNWKNCLKIWWHIKNLSRLMASDNNLVANSLS